MEFDFYLNLENPLFQIVNYHAIITIFIQKFDFFDNYRLFILK